MNNNRILTHALALVLSFTGLSCKSGEAVSSGDNEEQPMNTEFERFTYGISEALEALKSEGIERIDRELFANQLRTGVRGALSDRYLSPKIRDDALSYLHSEPIRNQITALLGDENPEVRRYAVVSACALGLAEARAQVEVISRQDGDLQVRLSAEEGLEHWGALVP